MKKIQVILFELTQFTDSYQQNNIPDLTRKTMLALKENGIQLGCVSEIFPEDTSLFDVVISNTENALNVCCEKLHVSADEVACVVDGLETSNLLGQVGLKMVSESCSDTLKQSADVVCGNLQKSGFYDACVKLGLIKSFDSKIFFFDIDGTVYSHKTRVVPESTKVALDQLRAQGHKLCICTSRSADEMTNMSEEFLNYFDAIVRLAGGHITIDNQDVLRVIDHEEVVRAMHHLDEINVPYRYVTTDKKGYLYNSTEFVRGLFDFQYQMIPPEKAYENEELVHFQFYPFTPEQGQELTKLFTVSKLTALRISFEVTQAGLDKSTAIQIVAKHYGYDEKNTVAFGDGSNDTTMLQSAYIGIAMGNGATVCKQASDYITDDIDEDGLYNACVHFGWIKK